MSSVIAKFHINSKEKVMGHDSKGNEVPMYSIQGFPVYQGEEENAKFFNSTPSGLLQLGVLNKTAADLLEPHKDYYVTIQRCPEPVV